MILISYWPTELRISYTNMKISTVMNMQCLHRIRVPLVAAFERLVDYESVTPACSPVGHLLPVWYSTGGWRKCPAAGAGLPVPIPAKPNSRRQHH